MPAVKPLIPDPMIAILLIPYPSACAGNRRNRRLWPTVRPNFRRRYPDSPARVR